MGVHTGFWTNINYVFFMRNYYHAKSNSICPHNPTMYVYTIITPTLGLQKSIISYLKYIYKAIFTVGNYDLFS